MFNPFYSSVKVRLLDQVKDLKDVQWFNDQYSSSIVASPIALIEFPEMVNVSDISKTTSRAAVAFCIHVVTKVIADKDASLSDDQVEDHDTLADSIVEALEGYQLTFNSVSLGQVLKLTGYQLIQNKKGWMITQINFITKQVR